MDRTLKATSFFMVLLIAASCIACSGAASMTVTASFISLAGYTINSPEDCAIEPPAGYTLYDPEEVTSDPAAQEPEYMFLIAGKDAVSVDGPEISGSQYCIVENKDIDKNDSGFTVTVNSHVSYTIEIDDFEGEVSLAEVQLCLQDDTTVLSTFIFAAAPEGDGVANNIKITALVDGISADSRYIGTIEVRATRDETISISVQAISDSDSIMLDGGELEEISFTDFEFVVNFYSPVTVDFSNNTVSFFGGTNHVRVFAQEGTKAECEANFFFPEDDPINEIGIDISVQGDYSILIAPTVGNFPAHSQIVLDCGGYIERLFTQ